MELTAAGLGWVAWTGVLVAVLLPTTVSLTALRSVAPLGVMATGWAALVEPGLATALGLGWAAATVLVALSPRTGAVFVDGSSYGDERRFPLRVPAPLLLGPIAAAWAAVVAGPVAGPLLLAAGERLAGALVLAAGVPLSWFAARALHGLARRWVVLVPAGMVLHDPASLADPVLFPRPSVERLGPAPDPPHPDALDLTARALGLVLEVELREPFALAPRRASRAPEAELVHASRVLFTPTRPGALLAEAARRRLPVG